NVWVIAASLLVEHRRRLQRLKAFPLESILYIYIHIGQLAIVHHILLAHPSWGTQRSHFWIDGLGRTARILACRILAHVNFHRRRRLAAEADRPADCRRARRIDRGVSLRRSIRRIFLWQL